MKRPGSRYFAPVYSEDTAQDYIDYELASINSMRNTLTHMRAGLIDLRRKIKELEAENKQLKDNLYASDTGLSYIEPEN